MADNSVSMISRRWNNALVDYEAAAAADAAIKAHPQGRVRDDVAALAAEAADRVYRVPAPTLGSLRQKLELLWATKLWEETYGADFKRIALGDLTRLEMLLAGVDPYDASGGMDLDKVAADFTEAARGYDHYVHLHREGPSEAWGATTSSDVTALMDEAEAHLLSLSAPNLGAVEKKLTILFGDDRFCEIDDAAAHVLILRDLRRFITNHQQ
jgi:hypothetical protein